MLVLSELHKTFGQTRAVDGASVEIRKGQMVGIIGRSGAGKSTLLRLINRLLDPTSGSIRLNCWKIIAQEARHSLSWRPLSPVTLWPSKLIERMDVLTNVLVGRIAHHGFVSSMACRFSDVERAMAIKALDRLDLAPQALQRAGTLSGGQQQRVAIAKAFVQNPNILLADEPIASLDPANASRVMDALSTINREDGLTVLVNLHTLDTARNYCDRIIAMRDGKIQFDGATAELTNERVHEIYGDAGLDADIDESVTSTSIPVKEISTARVTEAA